MSDGEGRVSWYATAESTGGAVDVEVSCVLFSSGHGEDWDYECEDWEFRLTDGTALDEEVALVLLDTTLDNLTCAAGEQFSGSLYSPIHFRSRPFPYQGRDPYGKMVTVHGYGRVCGHVMLGVITSFTSMRSSGGLESETIWKVWPLDTWLDVERDRVMTQSDGTTVEPDDSKLWTCHKPEPEEGKLHAPYPCDHPCLGKLQGKCKPSVSIAPIDEGPTLGVRA